MRMSPKQAAQYVGCSPALMYQLLDERVIPHYRVGGRGKRGKIIIDQQDLDAYMASCKVEAGEVEPDEPLRHLR